MNESQLPLEPLRHLQSIVAKNKLKQTKIGQTYLAMQARRLMEDLGIEQESQVMFKDMQQDWHNGR
jgi:hypothetical protein